MSPRKSREINWAAQTASIRVHKRLTFDHATEGQDHRNPNIQAKIEPAREDSNL
jgi:hypothetical protein